MCIRHFDERGFPKLDMIVSEIRSYVSGLEVEYTSRDKGRVIDTRDTPFGDHILANDIALNPGLGKNPIYVEGIYVIGGQARFLPESYNPGNHDLDLVVLLNGFKISPEKTYLLACKIDRVIQESLFRVLNEGKENLPEQDKCCLIDIYPMARGIGMMHEPYMMLYPEMKAVR